MSTKVVGQIRCVKCDKIAPVVADYAKGTCFYGEHLNQEKYSCSTKGETIPPDRLQAYLAFSLTDKEASVGEFKVGDVVTLKSGGPNMTVCANHDKSIYSSKSGIECSWFDDYQSCQSQTFHPASLVKKQGGDFQAVWEHWLGMRKRDS